MATGMRRSVRSERGAIFIQVAVSILVLSACLTFVLDFGLFWMSRGQAQNAADAGALAGAIARAFDEAADPPAANGPTYQSALLAAQANPVWDAAPTVRVSFACPAGLAGSCVRADVYRNGEFGSTRLPMLFGPLLNITEQGVRATATAIVATGNTTNCMRPFAVADRWIHVVNPVDEYQRWTRAGNAAVELNPHDDYAPGAGYRVPQDIGVEQTLKGGNNPASDVDPITPGWFLPIRLPDGAGGFVSGAADYRTAIATCIGNPVSVGQFLPTENGAMVGPTNQGVGDLIAQDPGATFNAGTKQIVGSCAPACGPISPRIVPLTVFDIDDFQQRRASGDWSACPGGGRCVKVVNILGYFVDRMSGNDVVGYLMTLPGEFTLGAPAVAPGSAFLKQIQLVR